MKVSRTQLFKTKGQLELSLPKRETISTQSLCKVQSALATILSNKYLGDEHETTNQPRD